MSIYDFSQYFPQSGLLSQPDFTQQQGLLARMDPWTSEYQQAAGTPGLFGHQTPELPTWQQQASFLPDWDKMFGADDGKDKDKDKDKDTGAIPGSDKDKHLQAGRTHHPGMYDSNDMWVGSEGGGAAAANWSGGPMNDVDPNAPNYGPQFMSGLGKVVGAIPGMGFAQAFNQAYNEEQPISNAGWVEQMAAANAAADSGPSQAEVNAAQAANDSGTGQLGRWF